MGSEQATHVIFRCVYLQFYVNATEFVIQWLKRIIRFFIFRLVSTEIMLYLQYLDIVQNIFFLYFRFAHSWVEK